MSVYGHCIRSAIVSTRNLEELDIIVLASIEKESAIVPFQSESEFPYNFRRKLGFS